MLARIKPIAALVDEMLDQLPQSLFDSSTTTFLDPAMGGGQFLKGIEHRLRAAGHSTENIKSRVFGFEYNQGLVDMAINMSKLVATCRKMPYNEFFKWDGNGMKFDCIVGNPPYQDSANESSYTNLWSKIFKVGFNLLSETGFIAMVTPKTWATPKQESRESQTSEVQSLIANHAIYLNIDECKKHFPNVGSSFTYSVLTKAVVSGGELPIMTTSGIVKISNFKAIANKLPKNISAESIDIFIKVLSMPMFKKEKGTIPSGNMIHDRDRTSGNSKKFPYRVQYSAGTVKWSDTKNKYQNNKKILFPNQTSHNFPIYDDGESAPANRGAVFLVNTKKEGNNFVSFTKSKLMQFIISEQRFHHGMLNTNVVSNIPKIDLTRSWTDAEIYEHFGLTQEEIDYVEANVK